MSYYILNNLDLRIYLRYLFFKISVEKFDETILVGIANVKTPNKAQNEATVFPSAVDLNNKQFLLFYSILFI